MFVFPIPKGYSEEPVWTGTIFLINDKFESILHYTENSTGWDFSLTRIHEEEGYDKNHPIAKASRLHAINEISKINPKTGTIIEIDSSSGFLLKEIKNIFRTFS